MRSLYVFPHGTRCSFPRNRLPRRNKSNEVTDHRHTYGGDCYICPPDNDGIAAHREVSGHLYEAELLLCPYQKQAQDQSCYHAQKANHPAFQYKGAADYGVPCTQAAERLDIFLLFYHKHGKTAKDVEGYDDDYKDEYQGNRL